MGRQIHHTSRCLGREFTFEEWVAYLKAHPDAGGEVVILNLDGKKTPFHVKMEGRKGFTFFDEVVEGLTPKASRKDS